MTEHRACGLTVTSNPDPLLHHFLDLNPDLNGSGLDAIDHLTKQSFVFTDIPLQKAAERSHNSSDLSPFIRGMDFWLIQSLDCASDGTVSGAYVNTAHRSSLMF